MSTLDDEINKVVESLLRMGVSKDKLNELSEQYASGALTLKEYQAAL
jgi:hypothetical protein